MSDSLYPILSKIQQDLGEIQGSLSGLKERITNGDLARSHEIGEIKGTIKGLSERVDRIQDRIIVIENDKALMTNTAKIGFNIARWVWPSIIAVAAFLFGHFAEVHLPIKPRE